MKRGKAFAQQANCLHGFVDAQRRLREPDEIVGVLHDDVGHVGGAVHEDRALRRVAHCALNLFVAIVADQQDLVVVASEASRFTVDLGDEWARRINSVQLTIRGTLDDGGRDTVGRKHHGGSFRNFFNLIHKDGALSFERRDDMDVVHDLLAHVDGSAIVGERFFDGNDGAINARAVATRCRQNDAFGARDRQIFQLLSACGHRGHR